jgi:hypothetical protein
LGAATGTRCELAAGVVGTCDDDTCGGPVLYIKQAGAPAPAPAPFPKCFNVTCGVCLACNRNGECARAPDGEVCPKYGGGAGVCREGVCGTDYNSVDPFPPSDGGGGGPCSSCDPECNNCNAGACVPKSDGTPCGSCVPGRRLLNGCPQCQGGDCVGLTPV